MRVREVLPHFTRDSRARCQAQGFHRRIDCEYEKHTYNEDCKGSFEYHRCLEILICSEASTYSQEGDYKADNS